MRQALFLGLVFALITACSPDVEPTATPTLTPTEAPTPTSTPPEPTPLPSVLELTRATDPSQQAFLSVVHAAADAPTFDVYIERLAIAANISFGQHTQPSALVAGEYFLRVVPNRERPDSGEYLYEAPIALQGGDSLMLLFTSTPEGLMMSHFPLPLEPLDSDQSRITVIHAIPDGPEMTMQQNGVALTSAMTYGQAAFPVVLPAGDIALDFASDGTVLSTFSRPLQERFSYVLVLAGSADNLMLIETRNSVPGRANLRAVNASAAIGAVDVYLDDQPFVTSLEYTRASERQAAPAQIYTVSIFEAGADRAAVEPLLQTQLVANNDDYISMILAGSPQDLRLVPYREDMSITGPDETRIAFVNTIEQAPRIQIELQDRILDEVGELGFAQAPQPVTLPAMSYRFTSMRMVNGAPDEMVELADNVQLEPGRSYLYLLTGRIDTPPVILSDNVGFDESLVGLSEDELLTPTPEVPTRVRFVNAIQGSLPVDIFMDGQPMASGLGYSSATPLSIVDAGDHMIEVRVSGQPILQSDVALEVSVPYTLVVYGFGTDTVELLTVNDADVVPGGTSPHFRLINLTIFGELTLDLAYSRTETATPNTTILSEAPESETFRRSMAFGVETADTTNEVEGQAYSNVGLAPLGPHDLHVVDASLGMIAASFRQVALEPGTHYDVFVYQHQDSMRVEGFALPYPAG